MSLVRPRFGLWQQQALAKIPEKQRAYIQQGHVGYFQYTKNSGVQYIATSGIVTCAALMLYEPVTKKGLLAHLDCNVTGHEFKISSSNAEINKKVLSEKNRIFNTVKSLFELINASRVLNKSAIQTHIIYTSHHDLPVITRGRMTIKDGYPLRTFIDESFAKLDSHDLQTVTHHKPKGSVDDVCLDLTNGAIIHYAESNEAVIQAKLNDSELNHPQYFQYYTISETGSLEDTSRYIHTHVK